MVAAQVDQPVAVAEVLVTACRFVEQVGTRNAFLELGLTVCKCFSDHEEVAFNLLFACITSYCGGAFKKSFGFVQKPLSIDITRKPFCIFVHAATITTIVLVI